MKLAHLQIFLLSQLLFAANCFADDAASQWSYRLGFRGQMTPQGLLVQSIDRDSPVLRMRSLEAANIEGIMDAGDVITAVDGVRLNALQQYYSLMDASSGRGGSVVLSVRDVRTGASRDWQVTATRVPTSGPLGVRRAHFVLIGDTNDPSVGEAQQTNLRNCEALANSVGEQRRGVIRTIQGTQCSALQILAAVRSLNVDARDTIFCYYGGHGAHDPALATGHRSGGHYFALQDPQRQRRDLMRRALSDALEAKQVRLAVLISDTCNIEQPAFPEITVREETRTLSVWGLLPFEQLLFDHEGIVDISGSDFGEYGFCEPSLGGWFTHVALPILKTEADWRNAYDRMRRRTGEFFLERKSYWLGQPHALSEETRWILANQPKLTPKDFLIDVRRQVAAAGPSVTAPREMSYTVKVFQSEAQAAPAPQP